MILHPIRWHYLWKGSLVGAIAYASMLAGSPHGLTQEPVQEPAQEPAQELPEEPVQDVPPAPEQLESFPPSPLDVDESDPLLPRLVVDRPLSPQERRVLTAALEELRLQAQAQYASGNVDDAFDIWIRELRLRRVLGVEEEVAALSRVGSIAWEDSQTTEVRIITQRLREIEQELQAQPTPNYDLLLQIAQAYQSLRARDLAVTLYDQILVQARQQGNVPLEQQTLTALGDLHLAWFDYPRAAETYQQLLTLARELGDRQAEIQYLEQLAYIYDQNSQPEQAIAMQQQLASIYENAQQYAQIPALKIALANNYLAIDRPDLAAPTYQEAFAVARSVQYYGYASEALQQLAELYLSLDRTQDALVVYQLLIDVEQQSYNSYGMMNAYDSIGQIYRIQGETTQAVSAFRQGLQLARQLNYRIDYFNQQIQALSQ
ncbi:MAG TPA: tetratricopeptide repeat protein [Elainellaceae cyanobacterium]